MNTFGQTETMGSITALGPGDHPPERLASVGKPLPGVVVRIVHPTTGEDVEAGTVGELWVRSDAAVVPSCALRGRHDTRRLVPYGRHGFRRRGGLPLSCGAHVGHHQPGREKFAPSEVEEVVRAHPAVRDVAAVGVIDPEMGHRVGVAVVVSEPLDLAALRAFSKGRIANFKQPELLLVVDELPLTDFGKVDRKDLRARFAAEAAS